MSAMDRPATAALRGRRRGPGFPERLEVARAVIGYDEQDAWCVRLTRDIVLAHADELARALYRHLLANPETAAPFLTAAGSVDRAHIDRRVETIAAWLAGVDNLGGDAAVRIAGIGRAHTRHGGEHAVRIRARFLLMAMGFLQSQIAGVLAADCTPDDDLVASIRAWDKLLMIHLDLFLAAFESAEGNGHWY